MISQLLAEKVGLQRLFSQPEQAELRGVEQGGGPAGQVEPGRGGERHTADSGEPG